MRTYKIRLLKCSGKDQKISAYLQLLTGLDKVMANRIVSNLPATLFDNLDEEGMEYFKEAFDFYEVEYEITPLEETCEVCGYPSRQVIVLGRIVEYYGQRNGFLQLAKKYNFETKKDLSMAPFLIRDGMDAEKAVKLQQELTNIGIRSQVIRESGDRKKAEKILSEIALFGSMIYNERCMFSCKEKIILKKEGY